MIDLHRFFRNPFNNRQISLFELIAFTTDALQKMIANNPGGFLTACIAAVSAKFTTVQMAFATDLSKLGLRKGNKDVKDAFRAALPAELARIHAALVVEYGAAGPQVTECFPQGRKVFGNCPDDAVKGHLMAMNLGLAAHVADLGAPLVAEGAALETSWTAIWGASESSTGVKRLTEMEKKAARVELQAELFKTLVTIVLAHPDDEEKLDLYMQQSLLEDHPAGLPLPGAAELQPEAPSAPSRAAFILSATDAATFNVYYRLVGAPDYALLADEVSPGLYETPDLPAGDYEFKAEGVNATGIGPESEAASVTIA